MSVSSRMWKAVSWKKSSLLMAKRAWSGRLLSAHVLIASW
jgi:hypothetical protein